MLKWPEKAKAAIRKLFEPLQSIDVYVEDTNDEAFYRTLLNKVSDGKVHIARVFSLGGREAVINAAKNHDHSNRHALFIIDGDLEWVRGLPSPQIIGLHRHDAYCIENLLLCEKAIAQILSQEVIITEDDAIRKLDISGWITSIQNPLLELFAVFATLHELTPEIQTVSRGVGKLCTTNKIKGITTLDQKKVNSLKKEILKSAEVKAKKSTLMAVYIRILDRLKSLKHPIRAISGKDYLLPLLDFLLQSHGCRIRRKSLRMRMAISGDLNRFSELNTAIYNAASGY